MTNTILQADVYAHQMALLLKNRLAYGVVVADPRMAVRLTSRPHYDLPKPRTGFDRYKTSTREGIILVLCIAALGVALCL